LYYKQKILVRTALALALASLTGCGAQYVRDSAQQQLKNGNYEKALKLYADGLADHPDSVALRAGQVTARETVFARLMTDALAASSSGNDKQAEQILRRAVSLNSKDERAQAMLLEVERSLRTRAAIAGARELFAKGLRERGMLVVEAALKDSPKNAELLGLQRKQELASKASEIVSTRLVETRPISLDFRDANLQMVLEALTRNTGVNFVVDKDVRADLRTTVFLRQTRLQDALELITASSQLRYKVLDSATVLVYPKTVEKAKEYEDLVIRAFYLSSADAKQTATLLKAMLKIREPFVDEKLNMIMVRETPETIRLAERVIALHDLSEPEVMMEVEVLEIKRSRLTELGIKYPDSLTLSPLPASGNTGFTLGNMGNLNRDSIGIGLPNVTLNFRRDVGDVTILANPKIRARNKEKAKILIGDKLPVVTTTGSSTNNGYISESVQYVDVGLKLDVEPAIFLDDEVAIKVGLEVSSLVREIKTAGGSLVYQIGTRTANTVLRLRDGETQMLAGLISNEERMSASRLPGLGDLPLIGRLFSAQRDDGQRTEIVLAITPRIIHNIRRPDLNQAEFWSGTENELRSRPLSLPAVESVLGNPADGAVPGPGAALVPMPAMGAGPGLPAPLPAVSAASLSLAMPSVVAIGETFAVNVNLKSDQLIRGMPLHLQFDPAKLELLDAEEGVFFKLDGAAISATKVLGKREGKASMAILRNIAEGIKGEGTVMTFKFKARAAGVTMIGVESASAIAARPVDLPLPSRSSITVK
jgi:general secretion pathway protein D